jgi:hypothetical protein
VTLRLAIGGLGAIGKNVARRLDEGIEGLILAAVAAQDITRAASFSRSWPLRWNSTWRRTAGERPAHAFDLSQGKDLGENLSAAKSILHSQ